MSAPQNFILLGRYTDFKGNIALLFQLFKVSSIDSAAFDTNTSFMRSSENQVI